MSEQSIETRYKAYLTRRSKWEALRACNRQNMVGINALRETLVRQGERAEFLDETWEKRVFGDRRLFEPHKDGGGFFVLTDEAEEIKPGKRPEWAEQRPGEDWIRGAYEYVMANVNELEREEVASSWVCLTSKWDQTAETVVAALDSLREKGAKEPLQKLWEVAMSESLLSDATNLRAHQVALWMLNVVAEVDAYKRLRAYAGGGDRPSDILGPEDGCGSVTFSAIVLPADPSPGGVTEQIRHRLVRRGIMKERA